uniref:Uncharacterized protein n=1 Tax=Tanacetum cinerariifolium TaxID=118510 RepID=A0A699GWT7_TANCI|nr:hypothetical protein [Tanacetum cinerariifolium]
MVRERWLNALDQVLYQAWSQMIIYSKISSSLLLFDFEKRLLNIRLYVILIFRSMRDTYLLSHLKMGIRYFLTIALRCSTSVTVYKSLWCK